MKRLPAALAALLVALTPTLVTAAPAAAASRQLCTNADEYVNGQFFYTRARVCVNYIPSTSPTNYYLVESTRVWNPCSQLPYPQYAIMKFWADDGTYYSMYTGAITCGQTVVKTWPYPRVANADFVYFTIDDALSDATCRQIRPPAWNATQYIWPC